MKLVAPRGSFPLGAGLAASAGLFMACSLFVSTEELAGTRGSPEPADGGAGDAPSHTLSGYDGSTDDGAVPNAASGYPAAVLADGPLVYVRLGERDGVAATDSSGHGTDGAFLGSVAKGIPGAISGDDDTAVRFGTANWDAEKVRVIPPFDFANQTPFSLEAWIKPEANGDGAYSGIIGRTAGDAGLGGWSLFTQYDVGWVKFSRADGAGDSDSPWYTTQLPRDRFTHVVGTYDGATMHLYIDGLDVGQSSSTRMIPGSTDPILIGPHFPGILDEVAIYDHALPADRVRAHHKAGLAK